MVRWAVFKQKRIIEGEYDINYVVLPKHPIPRFFYNIFYIIPYYGHDKDLKEAIREAKLRNLGKWDKEFEYKIIKDDAE